MNKILDNLLIRMWVKFEQFIHNISDWLEAIGFIIGGLTVIKVFFLNRDLKKLHEKHLFQVRVKEHLSDLKKASKNISNYLSNFPTSLREIKIEVSQCIEHCKSIDKKVEARDLSNLKPLIKKMERIRDNKITNGYKPTRIQKIFGYKQITEKEVDDVYIILNALISEIEQLNSDLKHKLK